MAHKPFTVEEAGEHIRKILKRADSVDAQSETWFKDGSTRWAKQGFDHAAQLRKDAFRLIKLMGFPQQPGKPRTRYDRLVEDDDD